MIVFTNNFHNTEYHSRKNPGDIVSRAYYLKVSGALCGMPDCYCGTFRGSQWQLEPLYTGSLSENRHIVVGWETCKECNGDGSECDTCRTTGRIVYEQ